jgi:hypothetical protein
LLVVSLYIHNKYVYYKMPYRSDNLDTIPTDNISHSSRRSRRATSSTVVNEVWCASYVIGVRKLSLVARVGSNFLLATNR